MCCAPRGAQGTKRGGGIISSWFRLCAGTLAFGVAAAAAEPNSPTHAFSIPAKPAPDALVDFALQAGISIGGTTACSGDSHALEGRFTLEEGLRRLLAGLPCRYEMLDSRTVKLAAAPAAPIPVRAAAAPPPQNTVPDEIMITATKRSVAADRLASAVSVLTADQLTGSGITDVTDTVGGIAGMSMTNLGPGRDKILLRGLSDGTFTGRTQSTVGTYLDDLPVNYNAPDPDLRLTDVEAVEVVRGPQGALYGSGTLSGIYRIVSRKPDPRQFAASAQISNAWTESAAGSRSAEGMLNVPLFEGKAAARVVAYGDLEGGYIGNSDLKQSDVDRTIRDGGRIALEASPDDNWTVTAGAVLQALHTADAQYTVGSFSAFNKLNRANRVSESNRSDFSQGSLTIAETGSWGHLSSATGYVHHDFANQYDASAALSLFDDNDTNDIGIYQEAAQIDMLVEDLVASSSPDSDTLQWLAGLYGSSTVESGNADMRSRPPRNMATKLRYQNHRRDRLDELAPYGELTWQIGKGWSVTGGIRFFESLRHTTAQINLLKAGRSRDFLRDGRYSGWTPKISLQHDFAAGATAYALYSEGYRPGGFSAGGIAPPTTAQAVYQPDRLKNYEIGLKSKVWGGTIELRTALFRDLWQDVQTDQYLSSGLSYTANVGSARVLGWENEIVVRPLPGLSVSFNDLYDSARLTKANPSFSSPIDSGLPGIPDLTYGGAIAYETPLDEDFMLLAGGEVHYVGRSRLTFQSSLSPVMGGYFTSRIDAGVESGRWRMLAVLDNPGNTQGDTFSFGNPFSFGQVRQVTPLRPRSFSLSLSAKF